MKKGAIISRNGILLFAFRVKQLQRIEKTAQIIDVERFQEKFNTVHVCPEERLKFVPNTKFCSWFISSK